MKAGRVLVLPFAVLCFFRCPVIPVPDHEDRETRHPEAIRNLSRPCEEDRHEENDA